jgi:hypothetical protein
MHQPDAYDPEAAPGSNAAGAGDELPERSPHASPSEPSSARALVHERLPHPGSDLLAGDGLRE